MAPPPSRPRAGADPAARPRDGGRRAGAAPVAAAGVPARLQRRPARARLRPRRRAGRLRPTPLPRRLSKKDADSRISPVLTLESSFESVNVKKFDVAFTMDPLYHQTTVQFDGGAKGLLLYNLGVCGSCCVLFDSFQAPDKYNSSDMQIEKAEVIDLSFAKEQIEEMVAQMPLCNDISPTLRDIVSQFDEGNQRPSHGVSSGKMPVMYDQMVDDKDENNNDNILPDSGTWHFGGFDDQENAYDENFNPTVSNSNYQEEFDEYSVEIPQGTVADERLGKIADLFLLGMGSSRTNAWAGPGYWKCWKAKDTICLSDI